MKNVKKKQRKTKKGYTDIANQKMRNSLYADEKNEINEEDNQKEFFYTIKQPTFLRSFFAVMRKNITVRRRTSSSFVTIFLMPFLILPITEMDFENKTSYFDERSPIYYSYRDAVRNISEELRNKRTRSFCVAPDTPEIRRLVSNEYHFSQSDNIQIEYFNDTQSMVNRMYKVKRSIGFYFWNHNSSDFINNPKVSIATKDFDEYPMENVFVSLQDAILDNNNITKNYEMKHRNYPGMYKGVAFSTDMIIITYIILPIVSLLGNEAGFLVKDQSNFIVNLLILSGCPHMAYWLSIIATALVCCLPSCIITSYYFTSEAMLINSDITIIFTIFFLFCVAQTFSTFLFGIFMQKNTKGKTMKMPMTVVSLLLSVMSNHFVGNSELFLLFSCILFPQIPYSQGMHNVFNLYRTAGPVHWSDFDAGSFSIRKSLYFLILSSIFHGTIFGLIILYQSTNFSISRIKALFNKYPREYFSGTEQIIEARDLRKTYNNNIKALDGVNFTLHNGDIVALIGPNGSGKSTLINTMTNTIQPDSGNISLFGHECIENPYIGFDELRRCSGVCYQVNSLIPELTVREHFSLFASVRGMTKRQIKDRTEMLLSQLNLDKSTDSKAGDLSGGQKRKLCIAIALLAKPPILILDEPTSGVDFESRQNIWKVLSTQSQSVTFITSHALEEAESACNKIFIMQKGQITFGGSSTELRKQFDCGYLLKIVSDNFDSNAFLQFLQQFVSNAKQIKGNRNSFVIPSSEMNYAHLLNALETNKEKYGIQSYTFTIEALEEVLLRIVQEGDVSIKIPNTIQ